MTEMSMKITVFKRKGPKETVVRESLADIAEAIRNGKHIDEVHHLRQYYHLMHPRRTEDGRMETSFDFKMTLPRLCFSAEIDKYRKEFRILNYNGLIVLEANNLADYDEAIRIRNEAARLPQTMMVFLGASGRSVKIVCRGELLPDNGGGVPTTEEEIKKFHQLLYRTARKAYNAQLDITLDAPKPLIHRTIYISADPDMRFREQAVPFYVDMEEKTAPPSPTDLETVTKEHYLMPGRSLKQTYILNYQFILSEVMGRYFELPDEERAGELLMQIAAKCLEQGVPQQQAINLTMCHPVFNGDRLLVEKTFEDIYAVQNMKDWMKRNKLHPLKSVPEDTLLMMKTDIFLHTHYEMRKNIMTGVAQYRDNNGEDDEFRDLDDEARNEMTMRAKEMGLKTWDRDIARFIESPRIEKFDPVNTWLDSIGAWDGEDRIKALAARVPTNQPNWEHYLHTWLLGMVAHWQGRKSLTGNALVPLLIGRQGCGKSSFCRILLPKELRDYYNDRINFKNETDLNLGLTSFALINIDEFDKTTARQQVLLKYLLSTADVKFRPPYGKAYKQYRRYASFIGTTNQPKPLTDPTGSRRFVCVEVTDMINFSDDLDHYQIYAQLKAEIEQGMKYWLDDDEIARLIDENERFQRIDSLEEMIAAVFRKPEEGEAGHWFSATEVLEKLQARYGKTTLKNYSPEKIGTRLSSRHFAFESDHKRKGNCYLMVER
jgi:predicted P-loop ATPase